MVQPYEKASQKLSTKKILCNNFIGGIAWALGATIGLSIILAILGLVTKNLDFVPIVGKFTSDVVDFVVKNNSGLQR